MLDMAKWTDFAGWREFAGCVSAKIQTAGNRHKPLFRNSLW